MVATERVVWNKGLTKETDERVKRNAESKIGFRHSEETKQKISESKKGQVPWMKGKKHTDESRQKLSLSHIGKTRILSEDHKNKISVALKGNKNQEKHRKEETKQKIRMKRLKQIIPVKDTSIEIALQKELNKRGIEYEKHMPVCDICQPDIVFLDEQIAIFADGNYWHSKEFKDGKAWEKDRRQDRVLKENGWIPLRFWGHEIRADVSGCVDKIIETLEGYVGIY